VASRTFISVNVAQGETGHMALTMVATNDIRITGVRVGGHGLTSMTSVLKARVSRGTASAGSGTSLTVSKDSTRDQNSVCFSAKWHTKAQGASITGGVDLSGGPFHADGGSWNGCNGLVLAKDEALGVQLINPNAAGGALDVDVEIIAEPA